METTEVANVIKGGETCIQTILSRRHRRAGDPAGWKGGLLITIKTLPRVEEFMQNLGQGEIVDVATVGRYWQEMPNQPLQAYIIQPFQKQQSDDGSIITLDALGHPLVIQEPGTDRYPVVNISFLRLRGISEGAGVTFGVKGVYSRNEMGVLRDRITSATRRFYVDYIRPIDMTVDIIVTVSQQEVQL